jgi:hypothetical protein
MGCVVRSVAQQPAWGLDPSEGGAAIRKRLSAPKLGSGVQARQRRRRFGSTKGAATDSCAGGAPARIDALRAITGPGRACFSSILVICGCCDSRTTCGSAKQTAHEH